VHRGLTSEPLAERPKSRRESGQNKPILQFLYFGRLFQFLDRILADKRPLRKGVVRLNIQSELIWGSVLHGYGYTAGFGAGKCPGMGTGCHI
jgi:hypothetical protein